MNDSVVIWDRFIRSAHWLLVSTVAASWWTRHSSGPWHEWLGYAALSIAVARIAWGFVGSAHARFGGFLRSPAVTWRYARLLVQGFEPRYLGHNPLGGWMTLALLCLTLIVCGSGWLYTTDAYWGVQWVEELHGTLSDLLWLAVALHVAGVTVTSLRHRENLPFAMVSGRKRNEPDAPSR